MAKFIKLLQHLTATLL